MLLSVCLLCVDDMWPDLSSRKTKQAGDLSVLLYHPHIYSQISPLNSVCIKMSIGFFVWLCRIEKNMLHNTIKMNRKTRSNNTSLLLHYCTQKMPTEILAHISHNNIAAKNAGTSHQIRITTKNVYDMCGVCVHRKWSSPNEQILILHRTGE